MRTDGLEFVMNTAETPYGVRKVVFIESAAATGGIQHSTLYLLEHLDRMRWNPLMVCPEEGDLTEACRRAGVRVEVSPLPPFWSTSFWIGNRRKLPNPLAWLWDAGALLAASRRMAGLLARERPDLVVTKGLLCHFYGGLAARQLRIPCVWHVQDFVSERFGAIYLRCFHYMAGRLPSGIIVNGSSTLRQQPEKVRQKTDVVYHGIDTQAFRPGQDGSGIRREFGIEPGELVIGNVARITPWKGQDFLLDAFARLVRAVPHARLLLAGAPLFETSSYEHRLRAQAQALGLADRVIFAGHRKDVPQILSALDIFAYTAVEKDVWPFSVLQAMAAAKPVVAFDIEGVREAVGDDANARLVPVASVEAFTAALKELAASQDLRHHLARAARKRAEEAFTVERYAAQMEASFDKALVQFDASLMPAVL